MPSQAASSPTASPQAASIAARTSYRLTFIVLAVGVSAFAMLQSLVSPVLPLFQADLHTNQDTVTWMATAYLLSASVCTPILGRLGDNIGKEKVFVVVLVVLAVGAIMAAVATSIGVMIVARTIQGIGGGLLPLSFGIIRDEFPREKVAGAVGVIAALLAAGGGLGLVLAGPIVNGLGYHWLFWIPAATVAVVAVLAHFVIPPSPSRHPGSINWGAALFLSGWLVALLLAVSQAPGWGWVSASVVGLVLLAAVLAVVWVRLELRSSTPLIDMRMMTVPAVWATNLVACLFGFGLYAMTTFLPEFLQTPSSAGYGFSASITKSGLIVLPMTGAMFIFGAMSGRLSQQFGAKKVVIAGSTISIAPFAILVWAHSAIWEVLVATSLLGVGLGLALSAMASIIVDSVPASQTGVASGMNANIRTVGGAIGAAVIASIVTSGASANGIAKESGYTTGFAVMAVTTALAALAGLLIPAKTKARTAGQRAAAAMTHPEAALVAAGTIVGDGSE